jgi:hypothetical protein
LRHTRFVAPPAVRATPPLVRQRRVVRLDDDRVAGTTLAFAQRFIFAKRFATVEMIREFVVRASVCRRVRSDAVENRLKTASASAAASAALSENAPPAERRREPERPRFQRFSTRNPRFVRPDFRRFERRVAFRFVPFHRDSPFSFVYLRATTVSPLFSLFLTFRFFLVAVRSFDYKGSTAKSQAALPRNARFSPFFFKFSSPTKTPNGAKFLPFFARPSLFDASRPTYRRFNPQF